MVALTTDDLNSGKRTLSVAFATNAKRELEFAHINIKRKKNSKSTANINDGKAASNRKSKCAQASKQTISIDTKIFDKYGA